MIALKNIRKRRNAHGKHDCIVYIQTISSTKASTKAKRLEMKEENQK